MSSKQYFDDIAEQWDTVRQGYFPESVRDLALLKAGVKADEIAADIGAGSGFVTEALIQAGLQVITVDQSQVMLEVMRRKFGDTNGVEYRIGTAEHLPIDSEAVRYAFANMYLHHVESPPDAIREMVRILKPGGKLVITDLDEHDHTFLAEEQHDRWMGFRRDDVRRWLEDAGLKNASVDCAGSDCCAKSSCDAEQAQISIFIAYGEKT